MCIRDRHKVVHAHYQYVLVVRAIENPDFAFPWNSFVHPPKKIVRRLFRGWHFERSDHATLRIYT